MTRSQILEKANACVNGDREHSYGKPENNFQVIADFWKTYLTSTNGHDIHISPKDVAAMLALLKLSRIAKGNYKDDNWIDLAGYAACGGEVEGSSIIANSSELTINNN